MPIKGTQIAPGTQVPTESVFGGGFIDTAILTVDNVFDAVLGIRPIRHIARPIVTILPGNIIRNVLDLPKPSELVEDLEDKVEQTIKGMKGGKPPKLPRL